jgi:nitroimidazol reductase NimA-like FMN-containing flavoprotein (pyridoxamine 5'-phosphate oxidase superfamily)
MPEPDTIGRVSVEPRVSRPGFPPSYGIAETPEGMLAWAWAEQRLVSSRGYWVVSAGPGGAPHASPVWGLWVHGAIVFSTSPESRKGRNLERDPRAVIHLESTDEVVILEGEVVRIALDDALADAYEAKYAHRPELGTDGLWYRLAPRRGYAWLERDYPRTATRFDFV